MAWKNVVQLIAKEAPELAGDLLTGDYVGMARTAISAAVGARNDGDAVQQAIEADPALVARLQQIDVDQYRAETERMKLTFADRDSARELQQVALENGRGDFQNWLAGGWLVLALSFLALTLFAPGVDTTASSVGLVVIGFLTGTMKDVLAFYFGSTQWSNRNAIPRPESGFMGHIKKGK